jgi:hypothetical protein
LVDFYRSFGMQPVPDGDPVPESIEAHRRHCRELVCDGKLQQTELLRYRAE